MARLRRLADQLWHRMRAMEFIPADVINAEAGTMDDYCTCRMCRRRDRG